MRFELTIHWCHILVKLQCVGSKDFVILDCVVYAQYSNVTDTQALLQLPTH